VRREVEQEEQEEEQEEERRQLLGRLEALELLPAALRRSELQLQEVQDRELSMEARSTELSTSLQDLCMKVSVTSRTSA